MRRTPTVKPDREKGKFENDPSVNARLAPEESPEQFKSGSRVTVYTSPSDRAVKVYEAAEGVHVSEEDADMNESAGTFFRSKADAAKHLSEKYGITHEFQTRDRHPLDRRRKK